MLIERDPETNLRSVDGRQDVWLQITMVFEDVDLDPGDEMP